MMENYTDVIILALENDVKAFTYLKSRCEANVVALRCNEGQKCLVETNLLQALGETGSYFTFLPDGLATEAQ